MLLPILRLLLDFERRKFFSFECIRRLSKDRYADYYVHHLHEFSKSTTLGNYFGVLIPNIQLRVSHVVFNNRTINENVAFVNNNRTIISTAFVLYLSH